MLKLLCLDYKFSLAFSFYPESGWYLLFQHYYISTSIKKELQVKYTDTKASMYRLRGIDIKNGRNCGTCPTIKVSRGNEWSA